MINLLLVLISILWFIVFTKKLFFWVYLWQLKEYHIGRFLDHFRTYKGKRIILNHPLLVKILVLLGIIFSARHGWTDIKFSLVYFAALLFFIESLFAFKNFWQKTFKKPVLTQKVATILSTGISFEILLLFFFFLLEFKLTRFTASLLLLDILTPLGFSVLVFSFQPVAVVLRNRLISRAKRKRAKFPNLLVIGITGSYGKTSTKEYLATILSERFKVLKTKEHQNSEVGISECILDELGPEHEVFVVEMGAYNRGGIKFLCDIIKPKIGILTGINEQHMATFGSQENIIKTKYELIESLSRDGIAFFNGNNKYCLELYNKTQIRKKLYGQGVVSPQEENLAVTKLIARELGMTEEQINRGVQKIKPWPEIKKCLNAINIIDATYSANPTGVMADLEYLKTLSGQPFGKLRVKKVIVMPCLIELGKASKEVHQRIGRKIAEICDLAIITTKDRFREIKEGAASAEDTASQGAEILFMERADEIVEKIKSFCLPAEALAKEGQPGDVVLLESRVPKEVIKLLSD